MGSAAPEVDVTSVDRLDNGSDRLADESDDTSVVSDEAAFDRTLDVVIEAADVGKMPLVVVE